ncbi:hypothetical protein WMF31_35585 [Sorangium sp. So ce1036]|uniref:hypothetical protein n=1 Tax=Sorangium sp. So ce1036 TaxID=3133328 RepID=UPI003EFE61B7
MIKPPLSRDDLLALVHEHNHVHNEHRRTTAESVRRKLDARVLEIEDRFERALAEAIPDEALRRAWRDHLHRRGPAPDEPPPVSPLVFRGRSEVGSEAVAREKAGGIHIEVDGAVYDRRRGLDLAADPAGTELRVGTLPPFRERFELPAEALDALRAWVERPDTEPPWRWARELVAEGLVDGHFALTDRGRRALALARRAA